MSRRGWWLVGVGAVAAACAPTKRNGNDPPVTPPTPPTCETARRAIETRDFVGWQGLPTGCTAEALFGGALDETWGVRALGDRATATRMRLLDVPGYYRPLASTQAGAVVMFDGSTPELAGGWTALAADLGAPEASRDFVHGTIAMAGGEHIHATRGITVFVNPENQFVVHVAVYAPTTALDYLARLRPSLAKPLAPKR